MGIVNTMENRFRWLSFPSLLRGIAIIQFVLVVATMVRPEMAWAMTFDWPKILAGEVWRIFSFLFIALSPAPIGVVEGGPDLFGLFFAFIGLLLSFLFNDALENAWGVWRTSVYFYGVILGEIVANILLSTLGLVPQPVGGLYIYLAAFFAFATLFPKYVFMLMMVIPVHVWILASVAGFLLLMAALTSVSFGIFIFCTFFGYFWWAIPLAFKASRQKSKVAKRRVDFKSKTKASELTSFHLCKKCGATEHSDPDLEFRVTASDEEICTNCLE